MKKAWLWQVPVVLFIWFWLVINLIRSFVHIDWIHDGVTITSDQKNLADSIDIHKYLGGWSELFYFTILTNIIVVLVVTWSWIFGFKFKRQFKLIVVTYSMVTFAIFWFGIAPFLPWTHENWYNTYINIHEHFIIFIVMFLWFYLSKERRGKLKMKWLWLLWFPALYLIANTVMYISIDGSAATYPFLNFYNFWGWGLHRWASVLLTCFSILLVGGLFTLIFWIAEKVDLKIRGRKHLEEKRHEKRH